MIGFLLYIYRKTYEFNINFLLSKLLKLILILSLLYHNHLYHYMEMKESNLKYIKLQYILEMKHIIFFLII